MSELSIFLYRVTLAFAIALPWLSTTFPVISKDSVLLLSSTTIQPSVLFPPVFKNSGFLEYVPNLPSSLTPRSI